MIPAATSNTWDWSHSWTPIQANESYYFLEHKGLKSIVSTRLYCQKSAGEAIEWPFVAIKLNSTIYKCNIKFIEYAFDIVPESFHQTASDPQYLANLIDKKVDVINYNLLKFRFLCERHKINMNDEILVSTIKIIEKYRGEWIRSLIKNPEYVLHPLGSPLPLTVLTNGHVIIEFPKSVEAATAKIIHEAYDYDDSTPLVCLRPKDPKSWKREVKVYRALSSKGLLRSPGLGFVPTLHIDQTIAVQIRCLGDLLIGIDFMNNRQKMLAVVKIAKAVDCLHQLGIAHGDIKLENVLFDRAHVYLIDFGFSCFKRWKTVNSYFGTRGMEAPELIRDSIKYEATKTSGEIRDFTKFDSFSFGVLLWSMLYKERTPFESGEGEIDVDKYEGSIRAMEKLPKPSSGTIGHVMRGLMKLDPKKRWKMQKAVKMLNEIMLSNNPKRGFDGCHFLPPMTKK